MPSIRRWLHSKINSPVFHISPPVNGPVFLLVQHSETVCIFTQQSEKINGYYLRYFAAAMWTWASRFVFDCKYVLQSEQLHYLFWSVFVYILFFVTTATLMIIIINVRTVHPEFFHIGSVLSPKMRFCLNLFLCQSCESKICTILISCVTFLVVLMFCFSVNSAICKSSYKWFWRESFTSSNIPPAGF